MGGWTFLPLTHASYSRQAPDCLDGFRLLQEHPSVRLASLMDHAPGQRQFASLDEVIRHYVKAPAATVGHTELAHGESGRMQRKPIALSDQEIQLLATFLGTLSAPIVERSPIHSSPARNSP